MKQVARYFQQDTLRSLSIDDITMNLPALRKQCGDRAVMRSFHFIEENRRVEKEIAALKANDISTFLYHVADSGNSSWKWLQNIYVPSDCMQNQSVSITLALTEIFISRHGLRGKAACRIHGGGFAGVIQVFLPSEMTETYTRWMHNVLQVERDPVFSMTIRPFGIKNILSLLSGII
jgi:galactokinase